MDLDSFVNEVESADVAAQVDATIDIDSIEPGWDDVDMEEGPVVDVEPVPDLPEAFDEVLEAEPEEAVQAAEEFEFQPEPVDEAEPIPQRSRRTTMVVGGVLLAAAIVVSVLARIAPPKRLTRMTTENASVGLKYARSSPGRAMR